MNVDQVMEDLLRREGGYTADKSDKAHYGKARPPHKWDSYCTNMGITQETLSAYYGRQATMDEVKNLDKRLAREIYMRIFLTGTSIHTLPETIVAPTFDAAVNHGPKRAVQFVQDVLNRAGYGPLQVDGAVGPKTRDEAYKAAKEMGWFFEAGILEERYEFYKMLLADPKQAKYRRGWLNRLLEFYFDLQREAPIGDLWLSGRIAAITEEAK